MKLKTCTVNALKRKINKKKMLCFGAGQNLYNFFTSYKNEGLENEIQYIIDNDVSKCGSFTNINGKKIEIKSPDLLKEINLSQYIIIISAARYNEIFAQIQNLTANKKASIYLLPTRKNDFYFLLEKLITKLPLKDYILIRGEGDTCDNTVALGNYICDSNFFGRYKIVWLCNNICKFKQTRNQKYITTNALVTAKSYREVFSYLWYYGRAKYLIYENQHLKKMRDDQIMVYLNHGAPPIKATKGIINLPTALNYAISPSDFSTKIICEQYSINKERVLVCGSPRTDVFFENNEVDVYSKLNIERNMKIILWTPTFRQMKNISRVDSSIEFEYGVPILKNIYDLNLLLQTLDNHQILLLIKPHKLQNLSFYKINDSKNIKVLSQELLDELKVSIYDLMMCTDALITDYSTIAFDYMLLNKPLGYTLDDMNEYKLGFSVEDIKKLMPGHHIYNINELIDFVISISNKEDRYNEEREKIRDKIHTYKDGGNSKRLCNILGIGETV